MALFIEASRSGATILRVRRRSSTSRSSLVESGEAADAFYPLDGRRAGPSADAARRRRRCMPRSDDGLEHVRRKGDQPMLATLLGYADPGPARAWRARDSWRSSAVPSTRAPSRSCATSRLPRIEGARRVMEATRGELGDEVYDAAAARGAAMSVGRDLRFHAHRARPPARRLRLIGTLTTACLTCRTPTVFRLRCHMPGIGGQCVV